jgi:hypothetical protein
MASPKSLTRKRVNGQRYPMEIGRAAFGLVFCGSPIIEAATRPFYRKQSIGRRDSGRAPNHSQCFVVSFFIMAQRLGLFYWTILLVEN